MQSIRNLNDMIVFLQQRGDKRRVAVVCANDNMAIGVYKYFKINSIKECAVTGFDDIPQARFEIPSLTTVHQPLNDSLQDRICLPYVSRLPRNH